MEELLQRLEKRIKELLDQHDRLKQANRQLHHGKSVLIQEKNSLLTKQQKAISQIETLVSRLKAIEKMS